MGHLFISYAHADGADFAKRLKADLEAAGYRVWWDETGIRAGQRWDSCIERAIRDASVVLAVLTPGSTREDSVCRDEVAFALALPRTVIPARLSAKARPTLLLVRRSWIDFAQGYDGGLRRLCDYLSGNEQALSAPKPSSLNGLAPLDFGRRIAELTLGFTGREWVAAELDRWLLQSDQRVFTIVGEPGIGKSAIAAWLATTRDEQVAAIHFCDSRDDRTLDPHRFVASVAAQLHARLAGYAEVVDQHDPGRRRASARQSFLELVVEPTHQLAPHKEAADARLIIVDSLDEATTALGETILDVLTEHARSLPRWLRVVATTRPDDPILERVRALNPFRLARERHENAVDVRLYLHRRLQSGVPPRRSALLDTDAVERVSEGNFLVAKLLADAVIAGDLATDSLAESLPGLHEYYHRFFRRRFQEDRRYAEEAFPLLSILCAALQPLPLELLARAIGCSERETSGRLRGISQLLHERHGGYSFFHKSLPDWLQSRRVAGVYWIPPAEGHSRLADSWWRDYQAAVLCALQERHIVAHLTAAVRIEETTQVLSDPGFAARRFASGEARGFSSDIALAARAGADLAAPARVLAGQLERPTTADHEQVRSGLIQSFGPYSRWPDVLRSNLEESEHFEVMLFLGDTHDMERRFGDATDVFARLRKMAEEAGNDSAYARACIRLAMVHDHQDDLDASLEDVCLLVSGPGAEQRYGEYHWWAQYQRGVSLRRKRQYAAARSVLTAALGAEAGRSLHAGVLHHLAVIDLEMGELDDAEAKLRQCLQERGEQDWVRRRAHDYRRLGQVHALRGELEEAERAFAEASAVAGRCGDRRYADLVALDARAFVAAPREVLASRPEEIRLAELAEQHALGVEALASSFRVLHAKQAAYLPTIDMQTGMPTGAAVDEGRAHATGEWHACVTVLALTAGGEVLLQQRSEAESYGRWDASVSGHVEVGEDDITAAIRETYEELGMLVDQEHLARLGAQWSFAKMGFPDTSADEHCGARTFRYRTSRLNYERLTVFLMRVSEERKGDLPAAAARRGTRVRWVGLDDAVQDAVRSPERFASAFRQLLHLSLLDEIR